MNYPLASSTWNESEYNAIQKVIDSDMFTMGKYVKEYEDNFSEFFNSKYCIMTSSGSTANLLMIASLFFTSDDKRKLTRGDEIIVPAVSWSTTYFPLQQYGLKLKFVDINRETLNIDIQKLESAITNKTRAILAVNLLGNPNDFNKINKLIKDKNILLLEDNCESMGAMLSGKYTGTFGLMGTYSSFFSHHIATMEGGCIITEDEELYHILLCLRAHGWTRNLPERNKVTGIKSSDPFEESFRFVLPGYNVRPLEMSGAIGIEQLKKLTSFLETRRNNAEYFIEKFQENEYIDIQKEIGRSSWFGFSFLIKDKTVFSRKDLVTELMKNNIECRPIVTGNFLKNAEVLKYFDYEIFGDVSNAEYLESNGFFVGNHQIDIRDKIDYLYKVMHKIAIK